ncbi:TetR/AcrR family transcriptional regulator [Lysobacter enzymogenes]|uniref:TetR/AcrR family transcriptional regulator n=1 Tax=Lysobacter enzymogenes TaxID=69 RepID=UPI0031BAF14A
MKLAVANSERSGDAPAPTAGGDDAACAAPTSAAPATRRPRGRPRGFDREQALETAMRMFWHRGFEATSISELTAAIGVAAPSLYAAFGSKEDLFRAALQRYLQRFRSERGAALAAPGLSAREAFARLFDALAEDFAACPERSGCMLVAAETGGLGAAAAQLREALGAHRAGIEAGFRARIERGQREGDVAADADAAALAKFLSTVVQGLSIQARDGASAEQLRAVLRTALRVWPSA